MFLNGYILGMVYLILIIPVITMIRIAVKMLSLAVINVFCLPLIS